MTSQLSTTQSVKQGARQFMSVASDKMKLASSAVARGDTRELDVAVIKSTTPQFHVVPKEKHVRTLKDIVQHSSKDQVREVIRELLTRLKSASDWLTACKALMVIHRLMKECSTIFLNALVQHGNNHAAKGRGLLDMGNFLDTTNIDGRFDFSEWVRGYGRYLDEQLEVYRELGFYPEMESGGESRMRTLSAEQLLQQLPVLQRLQQRLMDCRPGGAAAHDPVVQAALLAVLKESFKVYKAVSEGIINLADRFFEMEYLDALKGLEIYKESIVDNTRLQEYYREVEAIEELKRAVQFPRLEQLPADFLAQMEEYVREAPRPLEVAAAQPKKRNSPLRRGTKAGGGGRPPQRLERIGSGQSGAGTPTDPGMVGSFAKLAPSESNGQPGAAGGSGNLLDLDDLTISEPSPGEPSSAPQPVVYEAKSSPAGPSSATQPVIYEAESSPAGDPFAVATVSAPPASPYLPSAAPQPQLQPLPAAGSNPFGPSTPQPPAAKPAIAQAAAAGLPDAYGLPFGLPPTPLNSRQFGGPPMAAASHSGDFGRQNTFGPPPQSAFQPPAAPVSSQPGFGNQPSFAASQPSFGGSQPSFGGQASFAGSQQPSFTGSQQPSFTGSQQPSFTGSQQGSYSSQQPAYGSYTGLRPASSSLETHAGVSGQPGFGAAHSQEARSPLPSHAVAAGLTKPTNVTLAKEAALHDPFAGLAALQPKAPPRQSPPLKSLSPASGGVASHATSPGLQGQAQQVGQPRAAGNGFSGFGSADSSVLGPSAFAQPTQAFEGSSFPASSSGVSASGSSLI